MGALIVPLSSGKAAMVMRWMILDSVVKVTSPRTYMHKFRNLHQLVQRVNWMIFGGKGTKTLSKFAAMRPFYQGRK